MPCATYAHTHLIGLEMERTLLERSAIEVSVYPTTFSRDLTYQAGVAGVLLIFLELKVKISGELIKKSKSHGQQYHKLVGEQCLYSEGNVCIN